MLILASNCPQSDQAKMSVEDKLVRRRELKEKSEEKARTLPESFKRNHQILVRLHARLGKVLQIHSTLDIEAAFRG